MYLQFTSANNKYLQTLPSNFLWTLWWRRLGGRLVSLFDSKLRYCNSPKLYNTVSGSIFGPMLLLSKANHRSLCNGLTNWDGNSEYPEFIKNCDGNWRKPEFNAKLISKFSNVELTSRRASGERYLNWLNDKDSWNLES